MGAEWVEPRAREDKAVVTGAELVLPARMRGHLVEPSLLQDPGLSAGVGGRGVGGQGSAPSSGQERHCLFLFSQRVLGVLLVALPHPLKPFLTT